MACGAGAPPCTPPQGGPSLSPQLQRPEGVLAQPGLCAGASEAVWGPWKDEAEPKRRKGKKQRDAWAAVRSEDAPAMAAVAQWTEHQPENQWVASCWFDS